MQRFGNLKVGSVFGFFLPDAVSVSVLKNKQKENNNNLKKNLNCGFETTETAVLVSKTETAVSYFF